MHWCDLDKILKSPTQDFVDFPVEVVIQNSWRSDLRYMAMGQNSVPPVTLKSLLKRW